jgi:hypothetical protein
MKTIYTHGDARCPKCKVKLTAASDPAGGGTPSAGDISVCVYCAAILVFNPELTMRLMSPDEINGLEPVVADKLALYAGMVLLRLQREQDGKH